MRPTASTGACVGGKGCRWASLIPPALGAWPACLLLLAFAWIELVSPNAASPAHIAWLAIGYSLLTWAGMLAFGRDAWLGHGEAFSLVFGTLARFAPTAARGGGLALRPFGAGLLQAQPVSASMMAFVLLLLATVLYDGLIGTGEWALVEEALLPALGGPGEAASMALRTAGLIGLWLLFLAAYLGVSAAMSALAGGHPGALEIARGFALTLVPIAIGYHVAHYLVFLLVQGQYIIPLLSDPFGYGWNLFGTRRISRRHRPGGGELRLVHRGCRHRHRPRRGRLSRPRQGDRPVRCHRRGAAIAAAADRADGGLHVLRTVDRRPADCGEPGAARGRGERGHQGAAGRAAFRVSRTAALLNRGPTRRRPG